METIWKHTPEENWPSDFDPNDIFIYKVLLKDLENIDLNDLSKLKYWKGISLLNIDLNHFITNYKHSTQKIFFQHLQSATLYLQEIK